MVGGQGARARVVPPVSLRRGPANREPQGRAHGPDPARPFKPCATGPHLRPCSSDADGRPRMGRGGERSVRAEQAPRAAAGDGDDGNCVSLLLCARAPKLAHTRAWRTPEARLPGCEMGFLRVKGDVRPSLSIPPAKKNRVFERTRVGWGTALSLSRLGPLSQGPCLSLARALRCRYHSTAWCMARSPPLPHRAPA